MFRAGGWQKARQEQQMREWFGDEPTYLITQATDEYGAPKFSQDDLPKLYLSGHDVEEFVGVGQATTYSS
jgi:hypothetical protein